MRIMWNSVAPWVPTGYGTQTKQVVQRLLGAGHQVAISANYGWQGSIGEWNGCPVYPADHTVHYVKTGSGAGPHLVGADIETITLADLNHPGRQQASTLFVPRLPTSTLKRFDFTSPATAATQPN